MEKKEILDSFNCEHFNGEELVTVVGTSGLFSREDVGEMFVLSRDSDSAGRAQN